MAISGSRTLSALFLQFVVLLVSFTLCRVTAKWRSLHLRSVAARRMSSARSDPIYRSADLSRSCKLLQLAIAATGLTTYRTRERWQKALNCKALNCKMHSVNGSSSFSPQPQLLSRADKMVHASLGHPVTRPNVCRRLTFILSSSSC